LTQASTTRAPTGSASTASIVVIWALATDSTGVTQLRVTVPSIITEQAPHCAMPQPYLVPVMPRSSRRTHSSGVSPSASMRRFWPLMVNSIMGETCFRKGVCTWVAYRNPNPLAR
jgi:hypothetical protein